MLLFYQAKPDFQHPPLNSQPKQLQIYQQNTQIGHHCLLQQHLLSSHNTYKISNHDGAISLTRVRNSVEVRNETNGRVPKGKKTKRTVQQAGRRNLPLQSQIEFK